MTTFELLYLLTTLLTVFIATVALVRTRRIQEGQARLDRITSELAAKQLEFLKRAEREQAQASVVAELVKEGRTDFAFYVSNAGPVMAYEVNFELLECADSPLVKGDYDRKIPAPSIAPGSRVRLIAALHMGSPLTYRARVSWKNPDQSTMSEEFFLSV